MTRHFPKSCYVLLNAIAEIVWNVSQVVQHRGLQNRISGSSWTSEIGDPAKGIEWRTETVRTLNALRYSCTRLSISRDTIAGVNWRFLQYLHRVFQSKAS